MKTESLVAPLLPLNLSISENILERPILLETLIKATLRAVADASMIKT